MCANVLPHQSNIIFKKKFSLLTWNPFEYFHGCVTNSNPFLFPVDKIKIK